MKTIKELKTQIVELQKELETLKNPPSYKRWRAEYKEKYYYLLSNGEISNDTEFLYSNDNSRYIFGNYYKTQEEAEQARDKQLAIIRINDRIDELNEGWVPNTGSSNDSTCNYYIYYFNKYLGGCTFAIQENKILKYIKTKDIAEQIISEMKDDLDLIFNIK